VAAHARDGASFGGDLDAAVHVTQDAGGLLPRLLGHASLLAGQVVRNLYFISTESVLHAARPCCKGLERAPPGAGALARDDRPRSCRAGSPPLCRPTRGGRAAAD